MQQQGTQNIFVKRHRISFYHSRRRENSRKNSSTDDLQKRKIRERDREREEGSASFSDKPVLHICI